MGVFLGEIGLSIWAFRVPSGAWSPNLFRGANVIRCHSSVLNKVRRSCQQYVHVCLWV
jgi:hypothetical protein